MAKIRLYTNGPNQITHTPFNIHSEESDPLNMYKKDLEPDEGKSNKVCIKTIVVYCIYS